MPQGDPAFWALSYPRPYSRAPGAPSPVSSAPHCFPALCSLLSLITPAFPPPGSPPGLHRPNQAPFFGEILPQGRGAEERLGTPRRHQRVSVSLAVSPPQLLGKEEAAQALPGPPPERVAFSSASLGSASSQGPSMPRTNHAQNKPRPEQTTPHSWRPAVGPQRTRVNL